MKKILFITRSLSVNEGQGRYAIEMITNLGCEYNLTIFSSERSPSDEEKLKKLNVKIHNLPAVKKMTNPFFYLFTSVKLLPFFIQADIVHFISDYPYCTFFNFLPKKFKTRFITAHGTYAVAPLDNKISKLILSRSFKVATKIFCVSHYTEQQILKRINLKNTTTIHNAINLENFPLRGPKKIKSDNKIILTVGNLKNRKGYHISLAALKKVKEKFPQVINYVVGSKPDKKYFQHIEKLINNLSLQENVKFLENITDQELKELYQLADIFVLTPIIVGQNKFEGFGLVYLEAAAYGLPIIGTKNCGASEAIGDAYNGYLVDQENVEQTAEAIIKILSDGQIYSSMSENSLNWVKNFDFKKTIIQYKNFYNQE